MLLLNSSDVDTRYGRADTACCWHAIFYNECFRTRCTIDCQSFTYCSRQPQWIRATCSCLQVSTVSLSVLLIDLYSLSVSILLCLYYYWLISIVCLWFWTICLRRSFVGLCHKQLFTDAWSYHWFSGYCLLRLHGCWVTCDKLRRSSKWWPRDAWQVIDHIFVDSRDYLYTTCPHNWPPPLILINVKKLP